MGKRKDRQEAPKDSGFVRGRPESVKKKTKTEKRAKKGKSASSDSSSSSSNGRERKTAVQPLSFGRLRVGMALTGAIRSVGELDLTVGLPNNLAGHVSLREVSDELGRQADELIMRNDSGADDEGAEFPSLADFFTVGQLVRVVVVGLKKSHNSKHIELSMRPALLNMSLSRDVLVSDMMVWGTVSSLQDKGYIVNLGMDQGKTHGFLSFADAHKSDQEHRLLVGQPVDCVVKSAKSRAISLARPHVSSTIAGLKKAPKMQLAHLKPGLLVQATVTGIKPQGLEVSFLGIFSGHILPAHLDRVAGADWPERYEAEQVFTASILYTDVENKRVALTLKPHLIKSQPCCFPKSLKRGDTVQGTVLRKEHAGLFMMLNTKTGADDDDDDDDVDESDEDSNEDVDSDDDDDKMQEDGDKSQAGLLGFVHISQVSDDHVSTLNQFKQGASMPCRVLGLDYVDGVALCSMAQSVLDMAVLSYEDVKVGSFVKGTILAIKAFGLLVRLAPGIKAIVPMLHLADVNVKDPKKRFAVGQVIKCRVLQCNAAEKLVSLTHKKTMLKSPLVAVRSYEQAKQLHAAKAEEGEPLLSHGYVTRAADFGVIIEFYAGVHGLVSAKELRARGHVGEGQSPADCYRKGQVLQARVLSVKPSNERMSLSLHLKHESQGSSSSGSSGISGNDANLSPGEVASATVIQATADGIRLKLQPSGVEGFLPAYHLSDHTSLVQPLLRTYAKPGEKLERVLVVSVDRKGVPTLTVKPSMLESNGTDALPATIADVAPNMLLRGFVSNVTQFGVFVSFLGGLTGMASLSGGKGKPSPLAGHQFKVGQSVCARVFKVDEDSGKFTVDLRAGKNQAAQRKDDDDEEEDSSSPQPQDSDCTFVASFFEDRDRVAAHNSQSSKKKATKAQQQLPHAGAVLRAKVVASKDFGVLLSLKQKGGKLSALAPSPHHTHTSEKKKKTKKGSDLQAGSAVKVRVLDIDCTGEDPIADVSLRKALLSPTPDAEVEEGARVSVEVQLIREKYFVVSLPEHGHRIGFALAHTFNSAEMDVRAGFRVGQRVSAWVVAAPDDEEEEGAGRLLLQLDMPTSKKGKKKKKNQGDKAAFYDSSIDGVGSLSEGDTVKVKLGRVKRDSVTAHFGSHKSSEVQGRIHVSDVLSVNSKLISKMKKGKTPAWPLAQLAKREGELVEARVMSMAPHRSRAGLVVAQLSLCPASATTELEMDDLEDGQELVGYVGEQSLTGQHSFAWVHLSHKLRGRIPRAQLERAGVTAQSCVPVAVREVDHDQNRLDLALIGDAATKGPAALEVGAIVKATVQRILAKSSCAVVSLPFGRVGRVHLTDVSDRALPKPLGSLKVGQKVSACVLSVEQGRDGEKPRIAVSLRASRVKPSADDDDDEEEEEDVEMPEIESIDDITTGELVRGYVTATNKNGCFVTLGRGLSGRIQLKQLSDKFLPEPQAEFPNGTLVTARVVSLDVDRGRVELSAKQSIVNPKAQSLRWESLKTGMQVKGKVTKIQPYGLFIKLKNSALSGLCHISQISDTFVQDLSAHYDEGDRVKAVIHALDNEKKRISLSMKALATPEEGEEDGVAMAEEDEGASDDDDDESSGDSDGDDDDAMSDDDEEEEEEHELVAMEADDSSDDDSDDSGDDDDDDESGDGQATGAGFADAGSLQVGRMRGSSGLAWAGNGGADQDESGEEDSDDSDDDEDDASDSQSSKRKRDELSEEAIARKERQWVEGEQQPEAASDFERMVAASPNSSFLWIRYIAFQVSMTEIEKARKVAQRALKTISFREEDELFNVWKAWLNLENLYGSEESLTKVFKEALRRNDPQNVHLELASMYTASGKLTEAQAAYEKACKEFAGSVKVWVEYATATLKHKVNDGNARELLQKALEALPRSKHLEVISKVAQLHFKFGDAERGRAIFDGILASYPKRVDLWGVFLDMLLREVRKQGDAKSKQHVRKVFERATNLNLSTKKMKYFFERFLQFEAEHGAQDDVQKVKNKAREYVAKKSSSKSA